MTDTTHNPFEEGGGTAFPLVYDDETKGTRKIHAGMTTRDYFAAKAMTTMFYPAIMESIRTDKDLDCGQVAAFAYQMADAMLKERIKE